MGLNKVFFERAKKIFPGGVHSPVRSFKGLHSTPIFIRHAKGAYLFDEEGKDYIDFCQSFGPLILGHRNETVEASLHEALAHGISFGAAERYSLELGEWIIGKIPFIEQIRFVNSGTEAVMTAIRLARGFTGRDKILKFNGCYHGHSDALLIKAGSGLTSLSEASSLGISKAVAQDTIIVELDDEAGLENAFKKYGHELALAIIEPLPANNGLLIQREEFLLKLRALCTQYGALLILDEVISGFRVAFAGMSEKLKIIPDLVTYGKIIGGGLPVGAVAGPEKILSYLAPLGGVYQAGTLSANPLAMVGGLSTLKQLDLQMYAELESQSQDIGNLWKKFFSENKLFNHLQVVQYASLFWIVRKSNQPRSLSEIPTQLNEDFVVLFEYLLERGIYLVPNAFEVGFISLAHDRNVIKELEKRLWS